MIALFVVFQVYYWVGRRLGEKLYESRVGERMGRERIARIERTVEKWGALAVYGCFWVPMLRHTLPWVAGGTAGFVSLVRGGQRARVHDLGAAVVVRRHGGAVGVAAARLPVADHGRAGGGGRRGGGGGLCRPAAQEKGAAGGNTPGLTVPACFTESAPS
ncbi:DedA family protein [Nonomuraea ferruginea]